jgi:hypothetical protein
MLIHLHGRAKRLRMTEEKYTGLQQKVSI